MAAKVNLTQQQHAAIYARGVSVALAAGAGCGKTFVLTKRFLAHLDPACFGQSAANGAQRDLHSLVAITFTERAAREMRERIRAACLEQLKSCAEADAEHWLTIVRSMDSARISTIHSFCATLLRTHAVEAELDPQFVLLDTLETTVLIRDTIQSVLETQLAARGQDAMELVYEFDLTDLQEKIANFVDRRGLIQFEKWASMTPEALRADWERVWATEVIEQIGKEIGQGGTAREILRLLDEHEPTHPTMRERCRVLRELLPRLGVGGNLLEQLQVVRENARVQGGGAAKAWTSPEVYESVQKLFKALRDEIDKSPASLQVDGADTLRAAELGLRLVRLTKHVVDELDRNKQSRALLDFDDLLVRARDLLQKPEVRARAQRGISLLMVDEFQDTDPVQAEIVRHLCGDELLTGKLFLVGDAKQSIYRFRNAEPRVFRELRGSIPEAGQLPLSMNFRSQPAILQFVNLIFETEFPDEEPLVPSVGQLTPEPTIEFSFPPIEDRDDGTGIPELVAVSRAREATWIARRLRQLVDDQIPSIRDHRDKQGAGQLRTVEPRDIVILMRSMTDSRFYEAALRDVGLDYYVVGGQAFFAQQEVFDVINLCRFLDDCDDDIAVLGLLRSPFFSLTDDALFAIRDPRATLFESLSRTPPAHLSESERQQVTFAARVLTDLYARRDREPLGQVLSRAIDKTGYDAALLAEFLGSRKLANLRKLLERARDFDQHSGLGLGDFVGQLRDALAEETKEPLAATHPESSNVIRLMTIHQSKGLEFPVVVIADMDRKPPPGTVAAVVDATLGPLVKLPDKANRERKSLGMEAFRILERQQDEQESLRVLYVALTRAADRLILSASLPQSGAFKHISMSCVQGRFDVRTGQPRLDVVASRGHRFPAVLVHQAAPDVVAPAARQVKSLPLAKLRESVISAEPTELPVSSIPQTPDIRAWRQFNVSQLELVDADLQIGVPRTAPGAANLTDPQRDLLRERAAARPSIVGDFAKDEYRSPGFEETRSNLAGTDYEQLGTLVHGVLEQLDFTSSQSDATQALAILDRLAAASRHLLSDEILKTARASVTEFLKSPLALRLAKARKLFRELQFILEWPLLSGLRTLAGTIDCLYQTGEGDWVVLDYKTGGLYTVTDPKDKLLDYELQLGVYCRAVQQLFGVLPARVELAFLRTGVQTISFMPTQTFVDAISSRVTRAIEEQIVRESMTESAID